MAANKSGETEPMPGVTKGGRGLARFQEALRAFQAVNETMPIQIANSFLTVAQFEGRSLREYCDMLGVAQSTMSRHLLDLGPRNRKKQPGFGLIEQRPAPEDLRRNIYTLTPRGRDLCAKVTKLLED